MSTVEGRDLIDAKALRGGDNRSVDSAQGQISVLANQLCNPKPVACRNRFNDEFSSSEITEESDFGPSTEPSAHEIHDLGDHECRYNQWARMRQEQVERCTVVTVVGVYVGV